MSFKHVVSLFLMFIDLLILQFCIAVLLNDGILHFIKAVILLLDNEGFFEH